MAAELHPELPVGRRIQHFRVKAGMSRAVLGGLVGRSEAWVKQVETGVLRIPRLPLLLRLAEVLHVNDLAELTGEPSLTAASFGKARHEQLEVVSEALVRYPMDGEPAPAAELAGRVAQLWELWHGTRRHRTAIAALLPRLLTDARISARRHDGTNRREAQRALAQVYHLTQLFLSFQPAAESIALCGDRAMTAAQDADDPVAMAAAAWYVNHVYRDAGQQHDARIDLALDVAQHLRPQADDEQRALWGLLQLAVALSHAKVGHEGDAWRHWDESDRAVRALPTGYAHPWLIFGRGQLDAYAITMHDDLMTAGRAVRAAEKLDVSTIPSATRRSFHLIEMARAHDQRREPVATLHLLNQAHTEAPETVRFNLFTRQALPSLAKHGPVSIRSEAAELAGALGIAS